MYSSEDLERFYFQYKTESAHIGLSIEQFCLKNNVPYNIFLKWYKDTRKKIVPVQVDGCPMDEKGHVSQSDQSSFRAKTPVQDTRQGIRIMVDIRMSNGVRIIRKNLSYKELSDFVGKLEVLC